jgi:hypothetical protein
MVASPTAQIDFVITTQALEVLGNPVSSVLQLRIQLLTQQTMQVEVRDLQGHLLQKIDRTGQAGSNALSFPVNTLAKGTYIVKVTLDGQQMTRQFVKL